jgi:hypothetical protein
LTVDEIYKYVRFLVRENQNARFSALEFARAYSLSQNVFFDKLLGKITIAPHIALGQNERIAERLKPFKVTDATVAVSSQIATYPTGFQAITKMTNPTTGRAIVYVDDAKLDGRLNDALDPIAEANPGIFTNTSTGWKIWPSTISNISVSYYKLPDPIVWNFTVDGSGRQVYNSTGSVQSLWDDVSNKEIIGRTVRELGISLHDASMVQIGEQIIQQGE